MTPGLLPFVTAGSLCVMALILGHMALRRRHLPPPETSSATEKEEHFRTFLLAAFVAAYLLCLQFIGFEYTAIIAGMELSYGAFEVLTILFTTVVLAIFWGKALWMCLAVAAVWITLLAAAFRYVFVIPLPGSV